DVDFVDPYGERSNRVLRHVTLGIEFEAQGYVGGSLRPAGMQMELEVALRSRLDQPTGAFRKNVAALADCILVEEDALLSHSEPGAAIELPAMAALRFRFYDGRSDMVDNLMALDGNDLDTLDISIFGELRIHQNVRPL